MLKQTELQPFFNKNDSTASTASTSLGPNKSFQRSSFLPWCLTATFVATTAILAIFLVNANARDDGDERCPLVYDFKGTMHGAITAAQVDMWASYANWPLTHPKWSRAHKACLCDDYPQDVQPDPVQYAGRLKRKTPVWIAPGDMKFLFPEVDWPQDFLDVIRSSYTRGYGMAEHVKVCLTQDRLDDLWTGRHDNTSTPHCHTPESAYDGRNGSQLRGVRLFTGFDGDLYCSGEGGEEG